MAISQPIKIGNNSFTLLVGLGSEDGVSVGADTDLSKIDVTQFVADLKSALEIYPLYSAYFGLEMEAHYFSKNDNEKSRAFHLMREDESVFQLFINTYEKAKANNLIDMPAYVDEYIQAIKGEFIRRTEKEATKAAKEARRKERLAVQGYVYLIKASTGHYKIGRTSDPKNRLKTFNVKLPFEVEFECVIQTSNMYDLEAELHTQFSQYRINGEWFNLEPAHVEYIKSLAVQS